MAVVSENEDFYYGTNKSNRLVRHRRKNVPFLPDTTVPLYYYVGHCKSLYRYGSCSTHSCDAVYTIGSRAVWRPTEDVTAVAPVSPEAKAAYNRAYSKLLSKIGSSAALGTTLMEYRSALNMVGSRAMQIAKGLALLKKGRFHQFLQLFGLRRKKKHEFLRRSKPRDAASLWLEYWMGWAPTIGDIIASYGILTKPASPSGVRLRASSSYTLSRTRSGSSPRNSWVEKVTAKGNVVLMATVRVENPDEALRNQLGLDNPVLTLYELTPWSWLVDWFVNFGQVIRSVSDFRGYSLTDCMLGRKVHVSSSYVYSYPRPAVHGMHDREWRLYRRDPVSAFPKPHLVLRLPRLNLTRALTASSLMVQKFVSLDPPSTEFYGKR